MLDLFIQFTQVAAREVWKAILALGFPVLCFFLLAFMVKGKRAIREFYTCLPETLVNVKLLVFNTIFLIPFVIFYRNVAPSVPNLNPEVWEKFPAFIVLFITVFAGDFIGYWRHRLEHSRWLWPAHAVHHSDEKMTWLTLERFHPVNRLTTFFIDNAFLVLLGLPLYAIVVNNFIRHYYGYFIHADLPWTYGKYTRHIFVSPAMHRWHHAIDPKAYNTNFATIFSCLDLCFGTYRVPGVCDKALGVENMGKGFMQQMLYIFKPHAYKVSQKNKSL